MDKDASKQYLKMTQTPIPRLVVTLGIPTTVSMLVTNIYNMADTYFVSKLGTSASGAVGVVFGLMAIIQAIGFMFGHGAGSIISRKLGEKDRESDSRFASTSFFYSLAVGILFAIFGLIFVEPLMRLLGKMCIRDRQGTSDSLLRKVRIPELRRIRVRTWRRGLVRHAAYLFRGRKNI